MKNINEMTLEEIRKEMIELLNKRIITNSDWERKKELNIGLRKILNHKPGWNRK